MTRAAARRLARTLFLASCLCARVATAQDGGVDAGVGADGPSPVDDAASLDVASVEAAPPAVVPGSVLIQLRGTVLARGTREALAGATVLVDGAPAGETDEFGRFALDVTPGTRQLQIQHPGFEPFTRAVDARPDTPGLTLRLTPQQTGERYETVVTAPDDRAPRTTLTEDELVRVPGSLGDPLRTVESLPGVSQVVWPLAIYAIRGANPGNTGFFVDGVRMPALYHFALGPSVIHPFFIERLDFFPGGYPVTFGRYVAGVVSARTTTPRVDRPHASADVRLFDAGGIVAAPFNQGRGAVAVAGRRSYAGPLVAAFSSDVKGLSYWDYQLRVEHALGPGRLSLFAFGSGDSLRIVPREPPVRRDGIPAPAQTTEFAELTFHRADLRWTGDFVGGQLLLGGLVGWDDSDVTIRQLVSAAVGTTTLTASPRLAWTRPLASWLDLELGGDGEIQRFRPRTALPTGDAQPVFQDRTLTVAGGYLGTTARAADRFTFSPGIRYDLFHVTGTERWAPSPRLTLRFRPAGQVWLKAAAGRYAQMPSLPVSVPGFEGFGLREYGLQRSTQGSFGVEAPLSTWGSVDATAFYQRLRLTDLKSMFTYDPNTDLLEPRDGQSYGVELMLRRPPRERLYGWLSYTLSKSERIVQNTIVASDWDQRHILNMVTGYRLRRGYAVGARFHYNTGRPYPVFDDRTGIVEYQRLDPFFQLDLRADKRFIRDRFVLDVYVELVNSTFTRETFDLRRLRDGTLVKREFRIALPSVGVHVDW